MAMNFGGLGRTFGRQGSGRLGGASGGGPALPTFPAGVAATFGNVNQVMNPLMIGLAAGTPGTLPDYWTSDFSDVSKGVTSTVVGSGTEASIPYIDIRFFGTATAGAAGRMQIVFQHFVEGGNIARANAVYLKLAAGSLTNCAVNTFVNCADTANSYLTTLGFAAKTITGSALNTQKWPFTYTTHASTGYVDACMSVSYSVGSAFDVTVRIGLPQDERGATTHDLLISTAANDGFFSRALTPYFYGSHDEGVGISALGFPHTNGPFHSLFRGRPYNASNKFYWDDDSNPSPGVFDFSKIDALFAMLASANVTPVITMFTGECPTWVGTFGNPDQTAAFAWFTAFINRYKSVAPIIEGINEVDGGVFWTGSKAKAVAFQQAIYTTAKAANPNCIVIGPSTTGSVTGMGYMRDLLALNLGDYCDIFNDHSYNQSLSFTPELNLAVNMAHLVMYRRFYGGTPKPVWDTEGSYAHPPAVTTANLVDFLIKQGVMALSAGHEHTIWYATDNATYGTLVTSGPVYNDPATAFKTFRAWVNGATPSGPVTLSGNVWSMDFTRSGGYLGRILWDRTGTTAYTVPSGYAQYRDAYGQRFTCVPGDIIMLGDVPILLESSNTIGSILAGYVLSPAQAGKTLWDTARDGALPGGNYGSIAVNDGAYVAPLANDTNVFLCLSLCKVIQTYNGPLIKVTRASDSTTLDVYPGPDGVVSMGAYNAFISGTTVSALTWYDQSANAFHVAQATAANCAVLTANQFGSRPAFVFDGTNDNFTRASVTWSANDLMAFIIANCSTGANYRSVFNLGATATAGIEILLNQGATSVDWLANDAIATGNGSNAGLAPRQIITTPGFASGVSRQHDVKLSAAGNDWVTDGVTKTQRGTTAGTVPGVTGTLSIGGRTSAFSKGALPELIVMNTVYSGRTTLRANRRAFWNIPN